MKPSEVLPGRGRPVAYYPELARFCGSVGAAILLQQLLYWQDRAAHEYTFKKSAELEIETGLSLREQRKARAILNGFGILSTKHARLQHELHFTINETALVAQWQDCLRAAKPNRLKLTRRPISPNLERAKNGRFERRSAVAPNTVQRSSGSTVQRSTGTPSDGLRSHRLHQRIPAESTPDTPPPMSFPPKGAPMSSRDKLELDAPGNSLSASFLETGRDIQPDREAKHSRKLGGIPSYGEIEQERERRIEAKRLSSSR